MPMTMVMKSVISVRGLTYTRLSGKIISASAMGMEEKRFTWMFLLASLCNKQHLVISTEHNMPAEVLKPV